MGDGGAITGFIPQLAPDEVPNIFNFTEVFKLFFSCFCAFL